MLLCRNLPSIIILTVSIILTTTSLLSIVCNSVTEWQCDYGLCIDRRLVCDGKQDCKTDNSDERMCSKYWLLESIATLLSVRKRGKSLECSEIDLRS